MIRALDRILELCRQEVNIILGSEKPTALQEEQLISPILKYLVAFSNQPKTCTETQLSKKLSIPRPMIRKVIQALEAYTIVQPIADFGTVKPYRVTGIETAVKAAWIKLAPEEIQLLFSVRDNKKFDMTQGRYETFVSAKDGTRWLPPMEASSSYFSAITSNIELGRGLTDIGTAYQVDAIFLDRLLKDSAFWPMTRGDLLLLEEKDEITQEDYKEARKKLAEKYCWIYSRIAEEMLSQDTPPRQEHLTFMSEILQSCIQVGQIFCASQNRIEKSQKLIDKIKKILDTYPIPDNPSTPVRRDNVKVRHR